MARFLHHEPCPNCGSRDNLGRYDDGSAHCFGGCGYFEKPTHAPRRSYEVKDQIPANDGSYQKMPEDVNHDFPEEAVAWLAQYGVGLPEAISRGVYWSNSRRQLIFDMENIWQARNFNPEYAKKRKYFTQGDVNGHLPIYTVDNRDHISNGTVGGRHHRTDLYDGKESGILVLVEDCTSAIKIARQIDAMPLLGSHLSPIKLNRLARLYSRLIVWLDSDKLKEAQGLSTRARFLGLEAKTVFSELDPKCYTDFMIRNYLGVKQ